ncbi:cytochrome P450-like protein [Diplocarpon rosae]|nr:cytochrome P450-like protein [Diplocarpon rosae]
MAVESIITWLLQHWPSAIGVAVVAYLASNRFNRGLNRFPGPLLASLTDWWRFWLVYQRRPHVEHLRLHEELGGVVRLGPNCLSFSDPKALKDIYGLNKGFIKSEFYPVQQSVAGGRRLPSLFSTTSEAFHAQLRRSVNSAFSMSTLIQYEPFVDSTTELFLNRTAELFASPGVGCDFARWLQFYAFDVIGEMTYSKRHGFLERNEDVDGIVNYLAKLFNYVAPVGQIPFLDLLILKNPIYLLLSNYGIVDATFPVARFAQQRMAERFPADKGAVFYYLLKNPSCLERLYEELDGKARDGTFADNEKGVVTWSESQTLPYLDACIKEAFRMHPAPGLPLERIDADVFRPERWLCQAGEETEAEEKRIKEMGSTMLQFGMGSRTCIGKNISLLEMYKVVPSLLRRFEIKLEDPSKDWVVHNAWFVRQYGFRTVFKKRALVQPRIS